MRWSDLVHDAPALAERGLALLVHPGVLLVGTIRRDGTPRISPVEPLIMQGDLWLSMMLGSTKAADLLRDSRVLVHNIVTNRDGEAGEFKIRGQAVATEDATILEDYANEVGRRLGWHPEPGQFHLFRVEIDEVSSVRYQDGDQFVASWPSGREFVRRKLTATSLGDPEPVRILLGPPPTTS